MSTVLGGFNVLPPVGIITGETMLGVGVYKYVFTYATNFGETTASPASQAITSANSILITIPVGQAEVKTKHVYRTTLGGSIFKLLVILSNDVSTYLDVSPDAALGDTPPVANWASSAQVCDGWTKFSKPIVYSAV